ncbi:metallophosphoesterase [Echinicola sp. CAU 1574]|uniref:Metallophosphoesterase n=1 Tax=Echinicola arenosa TaxID=2774144 RepID=A0ABR9AKC1_9BACT|nr:metallophosphoesterase [Echinicola arenosa]MBD8489160.1 metallophosphoesterase [Echinicola arenosa]
MENNLMVRDIMRMVTFKIIAVLFLVLVFGEAKAQKDTVSILHITDLHVIFNPEAYIEEMMVYRQKKDYHLGEGRFREFLSTVPAKTKSDMVVATGDLIDFFESEVGDGSILDIQTRQFSKLLDEYDVPIHLTMGNHETFTFGWDDSLEYKLLHHQYHTGKARALWIRNLEDFKNGTYYSKKLGVGKTQYKLIFLDDSFYEFKEEDDTDVPYISKPQEYWLENELNASQDDVEIIFMHIPFGAKVSEKNAFYKVLQKHPSCKLVVAGHHHKDIIRNYPNDKDGFVQVQTAALVNSVENWRLIKLTEDQILVSETGNRSANEVIISLE